MKRLIVTADDFGLSPSVNEAVEQAHTRGILTAASLMVGGAAAADAVGRAKALPSLAVGLHLVLVDGWPVLPADRIPALVDARGRLRSDMVRLAIRIFADSRARQQLRSEIEAQFAAFAATSLTLDHVNAHKHFHLHPLIAREVLHVGLQYGMQAMRVPYEPVEVIGVRRNFSSREAVFWSRLLRSRVERDGVAAPNRVFGLAWSGGMTAERVQHILRALPEGVTELYTHPAMSDDVPDGAPGYRYREEFEALVDPETAAAAAASGAVRGGYRATLA